MLSERDSKRPHEYADERDMERFWRAARLTREPFRVRFYVPAILALIVASVPWYRPSGEVGRIVLGLPDWVWTSLGCGFFVAALTAWGVLRAWQDPDERDGGDA